MTKNVMFIIAICMLFVLIGCKNSNSTATPSYHLSGKIHGLVKQEDLTIEGNRIAFTLSLEDFNPTGPEFNKYNDQFIDDKRVKFVYIGSHTKIYDSNHQLIKSSEIVIGQKVSLVVHFINEYLLLADEIRMDI